MLCTEITSSLSVFQKAQTALQRKTFLSPPSAYASCGADATWIGIADSTELHLDSLCIRPCSLPDKITDMDSWVHRICEYTRALTYLHVSSQRVERSSGSYVI